MPKVTQLDSCIEVSYPVREATIKITHAEHIDSDVQPRESEND